MTDNKKNDLKCVGESEIWVSDAPALAPRQIQH
jgi:hypothetical protein